MTSTTPAAAPTPSPKAVHLALYDTAADWEFGHAATVLRQGTYFHTTPGDGFRIATVAATTTGSAPVTTMGGIRVLPDLALDALRPQDSALLILPGASLWDSGEELAPFARKAREFLEAGVPVAAICGATAGLAREGLLDDRTHTSAVLDYLAAQPGYQGADRYRDTDAVRDRGLITAGPTEPVAFAREIFAELDVMEPPVLDAWFRLHRHSDATAFPVLMNATTAR
ncbi:DJ-1/PfpI family protein [Streptomyces sp. MST-110588]|uniref:DJ-1/PfpI family protein n=1 Tax=Streptomyces sp. MST-110588 TaxID=2833628 RepID=UPI001F5C691D|nr:DJ-1/PfpI family protein [Streptomyces sp. MST-110588]UNO41162.1 DJ-1/PfpI family protein [Streptomyces sp. MST-110588]